MTPWPRTGHRIDGADKIKVFLVRGLLDSGGVFALLVVKKAQPL